MKPKASFLFVNTVSRLCLVAASLFLVSCAEYGSSWDRSQQYYYGPSRQWYQSGSQPSYYPHAGQPAYAAPSSQNPATTYGPRTNRMPKPQASYLEVSKPPQGWHHAREIRVKSWKHPRGYYFVKNDRSDVFEMSPRPFWDWWTAQGGYQGPIKIFDPFDPSLADYRRDQKLPWITERWY